MKWILAFVLSVFLSVQAFTPQVVINAPTEETSSEPGITFCSSPQAIYKNNKTTIAPDPPVRGQPLTAKVEGFLTKEVTAG
jgi:hypothetical protein